MTVDIDLIARSSHAWRSVFRSPHHMAATAFANFGASGAVLNLNCL
jgi:hypothetical protein